MNAYAYYNDNDPFCAEWLRRLIAAGAIPAGYVDERSVAEVEPDDLRGFKQCHFFAGIGGWAYALELAGWPADRPVWTGSAPCQPFSSAGRQGGALDERHLWPRWLRLIRKCRPDAILGEQVEGAVGFGWIDRVFADLEDEGYATGAAVLGAHSVGAPHIRQRLFWVADRRMAHPNGRDAQFDAREPARPAEEIGAGPYARLEGSGSAGGVANASGQRRQQVGRGALGDEGADGRQPDGDHLAASDGSNGWMADADIGGSGARRGDDGEERGLPQAQREPEHGAALPGGNGATGGLADADVSEQGRREQRFHTENGGHRGDASLGERADGWLADADAAGSDRQRRQGLSGNGDASQWHDVDGRGEAGPLAHPDAAGSEGRLRGGPDTGREDQHRHAGRDGTVGGMEHASQCGQRPERGNDGFWPTGRDAAGGLADAEHAERGTLSVHRSNGCDGADGGWQEAHGVPGTRGEVRFWSSAVWLPCLDGKARRVEPQIQPLATGIPNRVGLLRGSGNAITPQVAAEFIRTVMECIP